MKHIDNYQGTTNLDQRMASLDASLDKIKESITSLLIERVSNGYILSELNFGSITQRHVAVARSLNDLMAVLRLHFGDMSDEG